MKKLAFAVLAVAALAFTACKKEEKPAGPTESPAASPAPETKPTDQKPAEEKPAEEKPAEGGAASTGVPECDEYMTKAAKCFESDKWPAAARDAAKQGFDQAKAAWANLADAPAEAKKAAADACKQATDAMKQGADMMCPGVF